MSTRTGPTGAAGGKACRRCRRWKPAAAFGTVRTLADGLNPYCRSCAKIASKTQRERRRALGLPSRTTPSRVKTSPEAMRAHRQTPLGRLTMRLGALRAYYRRTGSAETAESIRMLEADRRRLREELGLEPEHYYAHQSGG